MKNSLRFLSFSNGVATYNFAQQLDAGLFGLRGRAIGIDVVSGTVFLRVSRASGQQWEIKLEKLKEAMGLGYLAQVQTPVLVSPKRVMVPGGFVFEYTPMDSFTLVGRPGAYKVKLTGGSKPVLTLKHFWLHTGINLMPLAENLPEEYFAMLHNPLLREIFYMQAICEHQELELNGMARAGLAAIQAISVKQKRKSKVSSRKL